MDLYMTIPGAAQPLLIGVGIRCAHSERYEHVHEKPAGGQKNEEEEEKEEKQEQEEKEQRSLIVLVGQQQVDVDGTTR